MKLHRLSIVVGEDKSEIFYREFICNATNDYYILPNAKKVSKAAIGKFDVHGVTHERYYAAVWLFDAGLLKEFTGTLQAMAIDHFVSCERLAHEALGLAKTQTVIPEQLKG